MAAKALPKEVVDKIHMGVTNALAEPGVRSRIEATGSFVVGNTPVQFGQQIQAEYDVYKKVVLDAKLKLD